MNRILLVLALSLGVISGVFAQQQTGTIKGTVLDNEGNALPGVTVEITSEVLMGIRSYVTSEAGAFRFPAIPPGKYTLAAKMSGFQTLKREEIAVRLGATITLNITMQMQPLAEEVTVTAPTPAIDIVTTKVATNFDIGILENIPLARDIYDIVNAAPGAIGTGDTRFRTTSFHGGGVRSNSYAVDGVDMTSIARGRLIVHINQDVAEEIEFVTSSLPADVGTASGAYINVVTRSGGNRFTGGASLYYTHEDLNMSLWTEEQTQALDVSQPLSNKSWFDGSVTLGGPIIKDKLWFFTNGRYIKRARNTTFVPFTDMLGRNHDSYDWKHEETMGFGKLTTQLTPKLKVIGMFNYAQRARPFKNDPGALRAQEHYRVWDENVYTANAQAYYIFNQNTYADLRTNYVKRYDENLLQPETADLPRIMWKSNPVQEITNSSWNEASDEHRLRVGTYFTHFRDGFLGGDHEIKFGGEWEYFSNKLMAWRADNLSWWWWKDSPYYFGVKSWKGVPNIGRSRIYFVHVGTTPEDSFLRDYGNRIGAYFQDNLTIAKRVTLNLGIRYDRIVGHEAEGIKGVSGNPIASWVGENYVRPYVASRYPDEFPNGVNPYGEIISPEFKNIMKWSNFSPRVGLTFDIFGDGKTVFKASYSRYTEFMITALFEYLSPYRPFWRWFNWYDMNSNGILDTEDDYTVGSYDFRRFDPVFAKKKLDSETGSPITDAINIGIERELFNNFSVGANFIYKHSTNIFEGVAWDPDAEEFWYHIDQEAAQKYYVPFQTIVPGRDDYPDAPVTVWVRKKNAPPMFNLAINVPELWRKYRAVEFKFQKRMSNGWQLLGSIVYSKAWGTWGALDAQTYGWEVAGNQPNFYTNREGRINIDRPLVIKLMATVTLPGDILMSGFYKHFSGSPWSRFARVRPPTSFTKANNAERWYYGVLLEPSGSRRNRSSDILDIRLEKQFKIGDQFRISAVIDGFNLLGWSTLSVGRDDVYNYNPTAENVSEPNKVTLESTYKNISSVSGTREIRFTFRFSF